MVAIGGLCAVCDDRVVAARAVLRERGLGRVAQQLGRERLAGDDPAALTGLRPGEERGDRSHRCLRGDRRSADALELGRRLPAAAHVEESLVGDDLDAGGAEVVRQPERERVGHPRARDAERLDCTDDLGRRDLVVVDPGGDEVVDRDRLHGDDLDPRVDDRDPVALDAPDDCDAAIADLGVDERVADPEWQLVSELEAPFGVAHDQDVGHAPSLSPGRAQPRG